MNQNVSFKRYVRVLQAGVEQIIDVAPSSVVCCTVSEALFKIKPDSQNPCELEQGITITYPQDFTKLRIVSETAQTVNIYIGVGSIRDNRLIGQVDINGGIKLLQFDEVTYSNFTITAVASAIIGSGSDGQERLLTMKNAGAVDCWLNVNSGAAPGVGMLLGAGESLQMRTARPVYAVTAGGTTGICLINERYS